ncbi:MAG: cyanophycinase, partial [Catalinimonas sp.]
MKHLLTALLLLTGTAARAQGFISYFTGSRDDAVTSPQGGVCLMGGASENDQAMRWFLTRADGGDVLVLRASGSDGYNDYLFSELGVTVNSVETIGFIGGTAANNPAIHDKIRRAEAIWFAGGNQWDYVSYWRNTPVADLINEAVRERRAVIGGTSAGMAILGRYYFSAAEGTVQSEDALRDPYDEAVQVDSTSFLRVDHLQDVITDTHYDNPDRKGRHVAFLARALADWGLPARGIACNEHTAVCIDEEGTARVYGDPDFPERAFFLQTNCEPADPTPEVCRPGERLEWNRDGRAVRVYRVDGTPNGTHTFSLRDWQTGSGGTWQRWYVENGRLRTAAGEPVVCAVTSAGGSEA